MYGSRRGKAPRGTARGPLETKGNAGQITDSNGRSFVFLMFVSLFYRSSVVLFQRRATEKPKNGGCAERGWKGQAFAFVRTTRSFVVFFFLWLFPRVRASLSLFLSLADPCRCFSLTLSLFFSLFSAPLCSLRRALHASVQLTATRSRSVVRGPREVAAGFRSLLFRCNCDRFSLARRDCFLFLFSKLRFSLLHRSLFVRYVYCVEDRIFVI